MLNCAWRPRINNYILNFRLDHFGLSVLFIEDSNFSLAAVRSSPRRRNGIFFRILLLKTSFPTFGCVQFGFIALVPTSLWHIHWVSTSCLCSLSEASFVAKFRSSLSAFPSERCRHVRRRPHSWLTTGENRLAKLIFVLLFGFLKDIRQTTRWN